MIMQANRLETGVPLPAFDQLTPEIYAQLLQENRRLKEKVQLLTLKLYGRSSERTKGSKPEEESAREQPPAAESPPPPPGRQTDRRRSSTRTGKARQPLPADLERVTHEHFPDGLTKEQLAANPNLVIVGQEESEMLAMHRPQFFVIRHVRYKVARKDAPEDGVKIAPCPPKPIPKGKAAASLLAWVVEEKFLCHQPLHRQSQKFKRQGLRLAKSTLCNWVIAVATQLDPIVKLMEQRLRSARFLHTDDTPVLCLNPEKGSITSRIWVYAGGELLPYVVYSFSPNRRKEHITAKVSGYRGYLQCDAYKGYKGVFLDFVGLLIEVGCWSHARRYVWDAEKVNAPGAWVGVELIGQLFQVEREAKRRGLKGEARKEFRLRYALGILADIREWWETVAVRALPKSPLGEAYTYIRNQWPALTQYLIDGDLELTNNFAERLLRLLAVGRNNWKFFGAESGGKAAATLCSLVQTCVLMGIDPWLYLTDVLDHLTDRPAADCLPDTWKTKYEQQARVRYLPAKAPT